MYGVDARLSHSGRNSFAAGFTAIEVAIFMVAATIIATISMAAVINLTYSSADSTGTIVNAGVDQAAGPATLRGPLIAERGDVDIDGNGSIDLGGNDLQAIVRLRMVLVVENGEPLDLTAPYTTDDTGVDPDFSSSAVATVFTVATERFSASSAVWTVAFPGTDDGDSLLEPGERAEVIVWLHPLDTANGYYDLGAGTSDAYIDAAADLLVAMGAVTIRIVGSDGASGAVIRTMPLELTETVLLN